MHATVSSSSLILVSTRFSTRSDILEGRPDPSLRAIGPLCFKNRAIVCLVVSMPSTFRPICDGSNHYPLTW